MFLFLPIGHEESRVRRVPWATVAIVLINVLAFLLTIGAIQREEEEHAEIEHAIDALKMRAFIELEGGSGPFGGMANVVAKARAGNLIELQENIRAQVEEFWTRFAAGEWVEPDHPLFVEWEGLKARREALAQNSLLMRWALVPADFDPVSAFTSAFLHGGWLHIIGNMVLLFLAAVALEDVLGIPAFLALYVVSVFGGAGLHTIAEWGSTEPCIGASGAVAGLMGAFLVRFYKAKIRFFYFMLILFRPIWGTVNLPAFFVLPLWFAWQLAQGLGFSLGAQPIAFMAHVGGFAGGAAVVAAFSALGWKRKSVAEEDAEELRAMRLRSSSNYEYMNAHRAWVEGRPALAVGILEDLFAKGADNAGARVTYIRALIECDRRDDAGREAEALSARLAELENTPMLVDLARAMLDAAMTGEAAARAVFLAARALDDAGDPVEALRWYDALSERFAESGPAPKAAFRAAVLTDEKMLNREDAARRFARIVERYPDHPLARDAAARAGS